MPKFYFSFFLLLAFFATAQAQEVLTSIDSGKRAQNVFFELLGPGLTFSANYDTRLSKKTDGLGIRGGLSYTKIDETNMFTLPVQLNYLFGKNGKYFEVGLGATYASSQSDIFYTEENNKNDSHVFGTMTFGYRIQPLDGGFMFRAGFSPVFNSDFFIPYYPYISLGYSF